MLEKKKNVLAKHGYPPDSVRAFDLFPDTFHIETVVHLTPLCFFFNYTATTEIYTLSDTLSLHDALPIFERLFAPGCASFGNRTQAACQSFAWRSEEHTSELQSPLNISYAVFCLKKK